MYIYLNPELINKIKSFPPPLLLAIVGCYGLFFFINSLIFRVSISSAVKHAPLNWCYGITVTSSLASYITPFQSAGVGLKSLHLKLKYQVPITRFVGIFALVSVTAIATNSLLGFLFSIVSIDGGLHQLDILFLSALLVSLTVLAVNSKIHLLALGQKRIENWLVNIQLGLNQISKYQLLKLLLLQTAQVLISATIMYVLLLGVDVDTSITVCILLATLGNLSLVIALTPANLGIKETFFMVASGIFDIDPNAMLSALLVDRGIQIGFLLLTSTLYRDYFVNLNQKP